MAKKLIESDKFNILLMLLIWVLCIIIVNPIGDFPYVDDFAYGKPVKQYLETGQIHITDWSSMTLIAHLYIGIFVTKIFGFSFTVLRITNLFFGFLCMLSVYFLGLEILKNKISALLTAFLIAFNPSFFLISHTFYTDINFLTFTILSFLFYIKFLKYNKKTHLILACLINIIAFLVRELSIVVTLGFMIVYISKNHKRLKDYLIGLLPLFIILLEYAIYRYWLVNFHGLPKNMDFSRNKMLMVWTTGIGYFFLIYFKNLLYSTVFFGIYLLPVVVLIYRNRYKNFSKKFLFMQFSITLITIVALQLLMPKVQKIFDGLNWIINSHHLFQINTKFGVNEQINKYMFVYPYWYVLIMIIIGVIAGSAFWFIIYDKIKDYKKLHRKIMKDLNVVTLFLVLTMIIYCIPIFTQIIDPRYFYFPLIIISLLLLKGESIKKFKHKFSYILFGLLLSLFLYDSVSNAHDVLTYNRIRWQALNYLNNDLKIDPKTIDGGFEYNAWHFYKWNFPKTKAKNFWYVYDDEYIVSSEIYSGYDKIKTYDFIRWEPPCYLNRIYIWKRK
jgi:4-amino-4-deoxy-L-arabinose transferase-like glycosyltransferase